jgi:hypothetical protein
MRLGGLERGEDSGAKYGLKWISSAGTVAHSSRRDSRVTGANQATSAIAAGRPHRSICIEDIHSALVGRFARSSPRCGLSHLRRQRSPCLRTLQVRSRRTPRMWQEIRDSGERLRRRRKHFDSTVSTSQDVALRVAGFPDTTLNAYASHDNAAAFEQRASDDAERRLLRIARRLRVSGSRLRKRGDPGRDDSEPLRKHHRHHRRHGD